VIEGLTQAHGYHVANPDVDIHLLLNGASAVDLVEGCPWVAGAHVVDLDLVAREGPDGLRGIPSRWDFLAHDPRVLPGVLQPGWDEESLIAAQRVIQSTLEGTEGVGACPGFDAHWEDRDLVTVGTPLPFAPNTRPRLQVPIDARRFATRAALGAPLVCVLPVSAAGLAQGPSPETWTKICAALHDALEGAVIAFIGVTVGEGSERHDLGFGPGDAQRIAEQVPGVSEWFDVGMWNQIALIERADLFIAPHTGFGFVAQLVETPTVIVSGCPWPDYFFVGTSFECVLPDCASYPASAPGRRDSPCMRAWFDERPPPCWADEAVERRIAEIVASAKRLLYERPSFPACCRRHVVRISSQGFDLRDFPPFFSSDRTS
jgi:hypothetical protein